MPAATYIPGKLSLLSDVGVSAPSDGQVLTYQTSSGKWINAAAPSSPPGGSSGQLQYNASGAFGGAAFSAVAGSGNLLTLAAGADTDVPLTLAAHTGQAANTSNDGLALLNANAATSGNQSWSGRLRWSAQGFKTTSVAGSQQVDFIAEVQTVQGTAHPSGNFVVSSQINGGGYFVGLTLSSGGALVIPGPNNNGTLGIGFNFIAPFGVIVNAASDRALVVRDSSVGAGAQLIACNAAIGAFKDLYLDGLTMTLNGQSLGLVSISGDASIGGSGRNVGFYDVSPVARQLLATGAGHTVDDVITALQALGLVRQS